MEFLQCYSTDWLKYCSLPYCTLLLLKFLPNYAQLNDKLYTFSQTFLAKEPIYNLTLEIYANFVAYMCYFYYCCCKLFAKYWVFETIVIERIFSKSISTIYIYMFHVLARNNEQFD